MAEMCWATQSTVLRSGSTGRSASYNRPVRVRRDSPESGAPQERRRALPGVSSSDLQSILGYRLDTRRMHPDMDHHTYIIQEDHAEVVCKVVLKDIAYMCHCLKCKKITNLF